jgi:hypothetical protein
MIIDFHHDIDEMTSYEIDKLITKLFGNRVKNYVEIRNLYGELRFIRINIDTKEILK